MTHDTTSSRANPTHLDAVHATVSLAAQFGQPLNLDQLCCWMVGTELSLLDTTLAVDELVQAGLLARRDELICVAGQEALLDNHDDATRRADQQWPHAKKWAADIGKIPFVRMVAITGALARGTFNASDTVELVIIVRPRRLWITRWSIARAIKTAAAQGVPLKVSYLTTTRTPEFAAHSPSLAWELTHMTVIIGKDVFRTIRRSNAWADDLFPNTPPTGNLDHLVDQKPRPQQKWTETLLLLPIFRPLENWTRTRQIARLNSAARDTDQGSTGIDQLAERFSTEVCDEHLGRNSIARDMAWNNEMKSFADDPAWSPLDADAQASPERVS